MLNDGCGARSLDSHAAARVVSSAMQRLDGVAHVSKSSGAWYTRVWVKSTSRLAAEMSMSWHCGIDLSYDEIEGIY